MGKHTIHLLTQYTVTYPHSVEVEADTVEQAREIALDKAYGEPLIKPPIVPGAFEPEHYETVWEDDPGPNDPVTPAPTLYVIVDGGCCHGFASDNPDFFKNHKVEVRVLDFDLFNDEEDRRLVNVEWPAGSSAEALLEDPMEVGKLPYTITSKEG